MRIVVLVKYVPDALERGFALDLAVDREVEGVLCELDEYALEVARRAREQHGGEVVALTMGPPDADEAARRALQLGADRAVHVEDPALHGSDALATSRVLAAAVQAIGAVDLVVTGTSSTDAGTSLVPAMVAARLRLPVLLSAARVEVEERTVRIRRDTDDETLVLVGELPAVVSVSDRSDPALYPTARVAMAARRKSVETWSLTTLGIDPAVVGAAGSGTAVRSVTAVPARAAGRILHDDGHAGEHLAAFLAELELAP
ncbi:electron transfer flavoprotein subunit beta/FixA family protein [Pengzhenrongella frigida]|uniref:Electron transfer flavoprotein subunit beta n=1 Tax=Pengzhenrongella frigida TaxID=1259133 RepID=A0A4Q5MWE3_9MICO|nr:electron transfer flavoprotein subunit beta/FixA family protein [Cellulomonas sp. HLT2-17]RYV49890.1 electron transfer flavoprotein beta subunit/FixA family protein [Cellulomonas sp. HLT2-17]